jgi:hypothetical protein
MQPASDSGMSTGKKKNWKKMREGRAIFAALPGLMAG